MVTFVDFSQVFTLIIFYTLSYNVALALFFISVNQVKNHAMTTTFALYSFPQGTLLSKNVLISFFSMAGIPPFLGFFAKISIFVVITNLYLFVLFPLFFLLLFSGLYFYIQNIRLILTPVSQLTFGNLYSRSLNTRKVSSLTVWSYLISFFLISGIVYLEDILLYSSWLLA